jgi:hypothetical protein
MIDWGAKVVRGGGVAFMRNNHTLYLYSLVDARRPAYTQGFHSLRQKMMELGSHTMTPMNSLNNRETALVNITHSIMMCWTRGPRWECDLEPGCYVEVGCRAAT